MDSHPKSVLMDIHAPSRLRIVVCIRDRKYKPVILHHAIYTVRIQSMRVSNMGNLRKNVKFQFLEIKWRKNTLFSLLVHMKFRVSKKIMRPHVTLLNIFSEIALF